MVSVHETAYPRLKSNSSAREFQEIFTPNAEEMAFARESRQDEQTYLLCRIALKTFQRLGYFSDPSEIPMPIAQYIARQGGGHITAAQLSGYKEAASQARHREDSRAFLGVQPYRQARTGAFLNTFLVEAARQLYQRVYQSLGQENRERLARLWTEREAGVSLWEKVKTEPGKPKCSQIEKVGYIQANSSHRAKHIPQISVECT